MARTYNTVATDVEAWVRESKQRLLDVVTTSLHDVVTEMQTTVDKGGKMRYDTGFLSWTGRASLNGWPSGQSLRPANATKGQYTWNGEALDGVLLKMELGDTFFYGWTAAYAPVREVYDGFMESGLQNWQNIVDNNVKKLKGRVNG